MRTNKKKLIPDTWNVEYHHVSYVLPNGNEYYHIERRQLDEIREDCSVYGIRFVNISNLIAHLQGKIWIKKRHLYEMADIIKKQKPNNNINWNHTYYYIEVRSQLDHLHKKMFANNEFEYESKMYGMVCENGDQMNRNAAKYAKSARAYIKENKLDIIPERCE